jgi:pimeloyl-ACP methyl ester carboxylesterase
LIPSFPFTNLSFGHIIKAFTDPEDATANQPFHLVIPSLPGLGFSDALPNNTPVIFNTAEFLNTLMSRLEYAHYLVTNVGSGSASPAEIDWKLANYLSTQHPDSCLGTHFISPPLDQPKLQEAPIEWAKWSIASLFQVPMLGYSSEDFSALERTRPVKPSKKSPTPAQLGLNQFGLREPNTLAYALCDSPTGLLVFALKSLRMLGAKREFTPTELIDFTQLAWLPGPEAAMRFWAHCALHPETIAKKLPSKPKVAVTVFLGDEPGVPETRPDDAEAHNPVKLEDKDGYACPSWANAKYHVVYTHRAAGKSGLLAWERPELIAAGVRGLAKEVMKLDARLKPAPVQPVAPLEQVVTGDDGAAGPAGETKTEGGGQDEAATASFEPTLQPPTPIMEEEAPVVLTTESGLLAPIMEERLHPQREISGETAVASDTEEMEKEKFFPEKSEDTLAGTSPGAPDAIHRDTPSPLPVS